MDYNSATSYINELENKAFPPALDNMKNLLAALGNPQDNLKAVHIAGTNGKGSTSRFLSSIMIAAGYKTGTFNSPHILDFRELTAVNHQNISEEDFAACTTAVKEACGQLQEQALNHPTAFECLTAVSLLYLSEQKVDIAVIEAGMGGRDDATNVFDKPLLCVLTRISEDHKEFLGDTIESIAAHKAGIIKKNTPVILAPNSLDVLRVVSGFMPEAGGKLYLLDEDTFKVKYFSRTAKKDVLSLGTSHFSYPFLEKRLLGAHQTVNLATALMAVQLLRKHFSISNNAILAGVRQATWPCRCEVFSEEPFILLDGAHNADGVEALAAFIGDYLPSRKIRLVFGVLKDKDAAAMLDRLAPLCASVFLTEPASKRKLSLNELKSIASERIPVEGSEPSLEKAIESVLAAHPRDAIVVAGSFYTSMPIRHYLECKGFSKGI